MSDLGNQGGKMRDKKTILDKLINFKIEKKEEDLMTAEHIEITLEFSDDAYTFIFFEDEFEMIEKEFNRFLDEIRPRLSSEEIKNLAWKYRKVINGDDKK